MTVTFSWEAISAISSALGTLVIAATVLVGYRQIRLASDQLAHLRSSTQPAGTMDVFAQLESPEFRAARLFVEHELEAKMRDPHFKEELLQPVQALDEDVHKEILVAGMFEKIGTYARHGLLDPVLIADYCGPLVREMWQKFEDAGYFKLRRSINPYSLENFEFLYDAAMDWYDNPDPPFRTRRRRLPILEKPADTASSRRLGSPYRSLAAAPHRRDRRRGGLRCWLCHIPPRCSASTVTSFAWRRTALRERPASRSSACPIARSAKRVIASAPH